MYHACAAESQTTVTVHFQTSPFYVSIRIKVERQEHAKATLKTSNC